MINPIVKDKLINFFNQFLVYILFVYIFFILGRSIWYNLQLKNQIKATETKIEEIKKQNKDLANLILYYQSDSFKEVEARKKLGYKRPDEQMIIVPEKTYENFTAEFQADRQGIAEKKPEVKKSNWQLWWQYLNN